MCYSIKIHYLFFEIKNFCLLQCILMGSDSSLAILKPTVKRDQTASIFTRSVLQVFAHTSCSVRLPLLRTILNRSQSAQSERSI